MITRWFNKILMDEAKGDGGGAGGGGGTSNLLDPANGGGKPAADPGAPNPAPGADPNKPAPAAGADPNTKGGDPADWRSTLPAELKDDATLKKFTTVHALAGAYLSAQKLIGTDKIPVPTAHTTDAEFRKVLHRLGLPEAVDKYDVKFAPEAKMGEEFTKQLKETLYGAGVLPKQAQAVADWIAKTKGETEGKFDSMMKTRAQEGVTALQKEWGDGFARKIAYAQKFVKEQGGEGAAVHLGKLGVGADPIFVKMAAAAGEALYKEHQVHGEGGGGSALTPKELDAAIAKLQADPAYTDGKHPQHKVVVSEITALFQKKFPGKS